MSIMCKVVLRYSGEYGQQCKKRRARRNTRPRLGGRGIARSHRWAITAEEAVGDRAASDCNAPSGRSGWPVDSTRGHGAE